VRVKAGTADPDFPDIPLGGWAGKVCEVEADSRPPMYLVEWTAETLAGMVPAYRRRCEREDLEVEQTWLEETDLEPDPGGPLAMEQPTTLVPLPLDDDVAEDRVRKVFGLTSDDDLPEVNQANLQRYHDYLKKKLRFPFPAVLVESHLGGADIRPGIVLRLLPVEEADPELGLKAEVALGEQSEQVLLIDLQLREDEPRAADLEAYEEWIGYETEGPTEPSVPRRRLPLVVPVGLALVLLGALVGGAIATMPQEALLAVQVGGAIVAAVGMLIGARLESMFREMMRLSPNILGGGLVGLLAGAAVGAGAGTLVVCYMGAIPGAIAGTLLARALGAVNIQQPGPVRLTLLGAYSGAMVNLFWLDWWEALLGCARGGAISLGVGLLVAVAAVAYLLTMFRGRE
jgi:hypothetical protein